MLIFWVGVLADDGVNIVVFMNCLNGTPARSSLIKQSNVNDLLHFKPYSLCWREFPFTVYAGLYPFEALHAHVEVCERHFECGEFLNITLEPRHPKISKREKALCTQAWPAATQMDKVQLCGCAETLRNGQVGRD
jgi:hypothetical protein